MVVSGRWVIGFILCCFAVAAAIEWLDRPIAVWAGHFLARTHLVAIQNSVGAASGSFWLPPIETGAAVTLAFMAMRKLARLPSSRRHAAATLASFSVLLGSALKTALKFAFGRSWPALYVRTAGYGFHPFHGGVAYESFPSGHSTAAFAIATTVSAFYPRSRPIWFACGTAVAAGLVLLDYHFLSDVIAGAFLGAATAHSVIASTAAPAAPAVSA